MQAPTGVVVVKSPANAGVWYNFQLVDGEFEFPPIYFHGLRGGAGGMCDGIDPLRST